MLAAAALAGGWFGFTRSDGDIQSLIGMLGGAVIFAAATLAVLGAMGVFYALVTSGLPAGLDSGDEPAATTRRAGTLAALAALLVLSGLLLLPVSALGALPLTFAGLVAARVARKHAAPGTWPRIVGTVAYFVCTWTLIVALAVRLGRT